MLKLSIIIPTYNSGEFLEQALLSIINQTYKNIEIIIIDGKSTDNTVDIIKKNKTSIYYWISEKDFSASDAVNKALKHVSGDIIIFFGSDDYYIDDTALEQMAIEFERNPHIDFLFNNINIIDRKTGEIASVFKNDIELFMSLNKHDDSILKHIKMGYLTGLVFPGLTIRRSFMSDFQFEVLNIVNDYDFVLHMWKKGCFFHYIDNALINVRIGGISHKAKMGTRLKDIFLVNKKYFGLLIAIQLHPWLLYFSFRYLHSLGFRPFYWLRTIKSYINRAGK
jgi:glycosyltransferase involved in cell wall biosynthesis